MIRDAIEKILELAPPETRLLGPENRIYSDRKLYMLPALDELPVKTLHFANLTSFSAYANLHVHDDSEKGSSLRARSTNVIVKSATEVSFASRLMGDNSRHEYAVAKVAPQGYPFGKWMPLEELIVCLSTQFKPNSDITDIINMLGFVANETVKTNTDDGFSQSIQVRTGITTKNEVKIKNPILLKPYLTFLEIEQPELPCILRLKNAPAVGGQPAGLHCCLWTADGGMWQTEAVVRIGQFLRKNVIPKILVLF